MLNIEFMEVVIIILGILIYSYNLTYRHIKNINIMKKKLKDLTFTLVEVLEDANGYKDEYTGRHIKRISNYSKILSKGYGCSKKYSKDIEFYSSLHDLGKVGIPDEILKKPGPLKKEERLQMMKHVEIGYHMVKKLKIGSIAENIVRYHHERWDGKGYLMGLKGELIPLEARIVALADVYDALRQKRVYKPSFSHEKSVEIIRNESGKQFEPRIVEIFLKEQRKFNEVFESYSFSTENNLDDWGVLRKEKKEVSI